MSDLKHVWWTILAASLLRARTCPKRSGDLRHITRTSSKFIQLCPEPRTPSKMHFNNYALWRQVSMSTWSNDSRSRMPPCQASVPHWSGVNRSIAHDLTSLDSAVDIGNPAKNDPQIDQVCPGKKKRTFWFASFILSSLVSMCMSHINSHVVTLHEHRNNKMTLYFHKSEWHFASEQLTVSASGVSRLKRANKSLWLVNITCLSNYSSPIFFGTFAYVQMGVSHTLLAYWKTMHGFMP